MEEVVLENERGVHEFAERTSSGRWLDAIQIVERLRRTNMVCGRADTADFRRQAGHFFRRPASDEDFKTSQFGHLEESSLYISALIEKNLYLPVPFESREGIDRNAFRHAIHR